MKVFRALVASCMLASPAFASAPTGALGGVVTRLDVATPLPNVEITLHAHDESPAVIGRTDAAGRFRFIDLPPGLYRLEARRLGFDLRVIDPIVVPSQLVRNEHVELQPHEAGEPVPTT